jgi:hypothetical protein
MPKRINPWKLNPFRRLYWKNKAIKVNIEPKKDGKKRTFKKWHEDRKDALRELQRSGTKTIIEIKGKGKITVKGIDYYKWVYQSSRYIERQETIKKKLYDQLEKSFNDLPKFGHENYSVTDLIITCVRYGEFGFPKTGNNSGAKVKKVSDSELEVSYFGENTTKFTVKLPPKTIEKINQYIQIKNKIDELDIFDRVDENTLREIRAIK